MDFVYLLRVLMKRKWIIIGSAFIAALIAWYFTKDEPQGVSFNLADFNRLHNQ
jgi:hypothetical protein